MSDINETIREATRPSANIVDFPTVRTPTSDRAMLLDLANATADAIRRLTERVAALEGVPQSLQE